MATARKFFLKRSKPNFFYVTVGVTIVLFIMGIMGWLFISFHQFGQNFKEDVRVSVYLTTANRDTINKIKTYIASRPYAKNVIFVDKVAAKKIWMQDNNENWSDILEANPLPESIDFYPNAAYVYKDSLQVISYQLNDIYGTKISSIDFSTSLVQTLNDKTKKLGLIFLVISITLCIIIVVSIDNTIRLAMFSNRFLIKTMQMVGATRGFIARPLVIKALLHGAISTVIAIVLLVLLTGWANAQFPEFRIDQSEDSLLILFAGIAFIGIGISVLSTYRSVIKYLKMKLDDLY